MFKIIDNRINKLLGIIIISILIFGCGNYSNPSESDAQKVYENLSITQIKRGEFKIQNFKKTNGQSYENMGIKHYKLEYEVEAEYLKEIKGMSLDSFSTANVVLHKKGDIEKKNGSFDFQKTERGWKAPDGNLY